MSSLGGGNGYGAAERGASGLDGAGGAAERDGSAGGIGSFRALRVYKDGTSFERRVEQVPHTELGEGMVRIAVEYSSLNYKDALSASGAPGVTRGYPHTPGIDAAGVVAESRDSRFEPGAGVLVTGFDLGMNTPGGYGESISVPGDWVQALPEGLTARSAMILGTAGFTAALALEAIEFSGLRPEDGPVAVSGASGGVGSLAVVLAATAGYHVTAGSGKLSASYSLLELGAAEVVAREEFSDGAGKPLLAARYAGVIDTVGGDTLSALCKSLVARGVLAACGLVGGTELSLSVFPFILRGASIRGIDSQSYPAAMRSAVWQRLSATDAAERLEAVGMVTETTLDELPPFFEHILAGRVSGRVVVRL